MYGPSKFKVRDFKADPDNVVFTYVLHLDQLDFRGRYQIDAQVLLLKLVGEGALTGVFSKSFGLEIFRDVSSKVDVKKLNVKGRGDTSENLTIRERQIHLVLLNDIDLLL